ncbi:uncharacterized protein LOC120264845 isoform X1 [Dioscorea cayenensis subsp. rotundata]|uniref:Uncharacterized protein LOC120264845 isoform X1 n=1 Tax=Dioscorea cayennensis subsp. rotundata TaxID=55577 RepID=A0AB40BMH1_DIOCR|nr:uncharacterized protein LOC120264845 isoform X1 [Dioscorea cayenensis subsp. rotundata]XP_039128642.1 uncharacterized protein LOC120264845 isoform X1 [Dioscorea cayenensis subsp. rotundata]
MVIQVESLSLGKNNWFIILLVSKLNPPFGMSYRLSISKILPVTKKEVFHALQSLPSGCCNNSAKSDIEVKALALIAAMGSIRVLNFQIKTIFIANVDLHKAIMSGDPQHTWRLYPLISSIIDYMSSLGNRQIHIIPRSWMTAAVSLAYHGANSHVLTLFHHGRDLPHWLMKQLNRNGILL